MVAFTIISLQSPIVQRLTGASSQADKTELPRTTRDGAWSGQIARAAVRALLSREHPGSEWNFRIDARGKPFVEDRKGRRGPGISISHTRGWIACAIARHPVGIDIETHRQRDYSAIAEYAFGARENALVRRHGGSAFYRIWTVREAIGKATGEGLALVTDRRDRAHDGPEEGCWSAQNPDGTWLLAHMRPSPAVSAALALLPDTRAAWTDEPFEEINAETLF